MKKINKRECRKFAGCGWRIESGHGLLIAEQIEYILRAAVRLIGNQRLLVLSVYLRKEAAEGDFTPKWTVFQGREEYITLERGDDGIARWRTAAFEYLNRDYRFTEKCAFYSRKDEACVVSFFRSQENGLRALLRGQRRIFDKQSRRRQMKREREVLARMKRLPKIPKGVEPWIQENVLPAYFFYDYKRGKRKKGICSACGSESVLENVRNNAEGTCPDCGHRWIMKARGRRGKIYDRVTCQVIQKVGPREVVIRILKAHYHYDQSERIQRTSLYENARIFVGVDEKGNIKTEEFYYSFGEGILTRWKRGKRPVFCLWQQTFEADTCGHVYGGNLKRGLKGTPWQHCPVRQFYEYAREPKEMEPFLVEYLKHPRLEHLIKTGFYRLSSDLVYGSSYPSFLDESQNRTHQILRVAAEDVSYLRRLDVSEKHLAQFQKYCLNNLKDRQRLLDWQIRNEVERDICQITARITAHKMMRYLERQYVLLCVRKTRYGSLRYRNMQELVSEYRDYLDMCAEQNYDMKNSFVLYPADLQKAHDKVAHRIKMKANAKMRRDFKAAYRRIMNRLDFEWKGMKIVYPASPEEIISEGHALHHCVGGYVDRVAKKECMILFLRLCEEEKKPFYTIEIRNQEVTQVRGMKNKSATPEVEEFMKRWSRRVLEAPERKKAA